MEKRIDILSCVNAWLCSRPRDRRAGRVDTNRLGTQAIRPDNFVAVASYAEGLGYIGAEKFFGEGGYEITVSATTLADEKAIMDGVRKLLK